MRSELMEDERPASPDLGKHIEFVDLTQPRVDTQIIDGLQPERPSLADVLRRNAQVIASSWNDDHRIMSHALRAHSGSTFPEFASPLDRI